MIKRVVLKLDGSIQQGYKVTAEVGVEGSYPEIELPGRLPPYPNLEDWIYRWQTIYRGLELQTRLVPKQTVYSKPMADVIQHFSPLFYNFGEELNNWLSSTEFRQVDKNLRAELNKNETIHILIRSEDSQLANLPWHLWDFMGVFRKAEIAFSTSNYKKINRKNRTSKSQVRILAILGSSDGINVEADRQILNSYEDAEIEFLVEPEREQINDQLWSQPWDVLFFAGHTQTKENKGIIHINSNDTLAIEDLKNCLRKSVEQGLQLVIFNSCDGLGLANKLESLNVPQMIVMREPIPDQVAQKFLKSFLRAFSSGSTLYESVRDARENLMILENKFPCATWLPTIFQNPAEVPPSWSSLGGSIGKNDCQSEIKTTGTVSEKRIASSSTNKSSITTQEQEGEKKQRNIIPILESSICSTDLDKIPVTTGIVIDPIPPDGCGLVSYGSSYWPACVYHGAQIPNEISEGEKVTVVGKIDKSNTLIVVPFGHPPPSLESQRKPSFFLFNLFR